MTTDDTLRSTTWHVRCNAAPLRDRDNQLSLRELVVMTRQQANLFDFFGHIATRAKWLLAWWLLRDPASGHLKKEDVRGIFDGTAFYRLAGRNR